MRFSQRTLELIAIALISSPHITLAAPTSGSQAVEARGGRGSTPPPDNKPDEFPKGDAKDLIPWTDDDYTQEDYKSFPDYDPDQDNDELDKKKRSIDDHLVTRAPQPPKKDTTEWLRYVGVDGTDVRTAFLASGDKSFIGDTGDLKKTNQIGMLYSTDEIPPPTPKPKNFIKWQADHIQDLGFYVTIARENTPDGIQDSTWITIQDTILGEQDDNTKLPGDNTKQLGKELNNPNNIRGINGIINQCKNALMAFTYGTAPTKTAWSNWNRSTVWALYRYMKGTKDQFDEITAKGTSTITDLIMDEDQGKKIAQHYEDEINRMYNRAITELERVLKDAPPDNDKDSIFKKEDCKNTKDSPDTPPAPDPTTVDPPSATVAPVSPPGQSSCVPAPTGSVKDAHEADTKLAAAYFCKEYASTTVTTPNVNIAHTIMAGTKSHPHGSIETAWDYTGTDSEDDVYDISVKSVDNCKPDGGAYNLGTPIPDNVCADILLNAWKGCNNQGRGGSLTAGCLVYNIATKY